MPEQAQPKILNQTLGELLKSNNQAQGMVMKAMQISPQQLQELLNTASSSAPGSEANNLMNMSVGDLFKNGIVQQAAGNVKQVSPEQFAQIVNSLPIMQKSTLNSQSVPQSIPQNIPQGEIITSQVVTQKKLSFWQRLQNFLSSFIK